MNKKALLCLLFGHKRRGTGRHCRWCGGKVFESLFLTTDHIPPAEPRRHRRSRYMREGNND